MIIAAWLVLQLLAADPVRTAEASQPLGQLAIFSPLVGREWVSAFPGNDVTDTQRFEWALGARFLRNVHHVRSGGRADRVRTVIRIGAEQWTSAGAQQRAGKWTE